MASALSGTAPTNDRLRKIDRFVDLSGLRVARRMKEGIVGGEAFALQSFFLAASDGGEHKGTGRLHLASLVPIKMRQVPETLSSN